MLHRGVWRTGKSQSSLWRVLLGTESSAFISSIGTPRRGESNSATESTPETDAASGHSKASGAGRHGGVWVRVRNAPKYALKEEVLEAVAPKDYDMKPTDVKAYLESDLTLNGWMVRFPDVESYNRSKELLPEPRLGSRKLGVHLCKEEERTSFSDPRSFNQRMDGWRNKSLIMNGVAEDVLVEDMERFFEGFALVPQCFYSVKVVHKDVRTPPRFRAKGETRPVLDIVEKKTMVRFETEAEAHRALREKHREFLGDHTIELRLFQ